MKTKFSPKKAPRVKVPGMWILLAVAIACCVPGVAFAQVFDTNLIVNGNAESGPGSTDGSTPPVPNAPGWTLTGTFLVVPYDFDVGWPSSTDPGSPTRASNFFIGGESSANSSAAQSIDVSEGAAAIDANSVSYNLSGWLGGYDSEGDNAKLTITFRNAGATAIGTASIGPVTMSDRSNITGMLFRQTGGAVPVGTRTIDVVLQMTYTNTVYNDGDADDLSLILSNHGSNQYSYKLYYPHVASVGKWETEICAINTGSESIEGVFKAYNGEGISVSDDIAVTLGAHERREITVGDEFTDPSNIGYIIFESDSETVVGYTKFYITGKYRVAIPATSAINTGDIYISHIASNGEWWTGISILNTTSLSKELTVEFDNGTTITKSIAAKEHKAFTISSLFGDVPQPDINSAVIKNGGGIVGLELFGSTDNSGNNYLSGILLKDETTTHIYYPHIASDSTWWTGIVAYNPSATSCNLTITPFSESGTSLTPQTIPLPGKKQYIGLIESLNFPVGTAWFKIDATSPVTGFELFGTNDGKQLGGYTGVGISGTDGVFAKTEKDGWTGIAFVNIEDSPATVTITAYDDSGSVIATKTLNVSAHQKVVALAPNLFSQDISNATYISYSSDGEVVGFQLNGSSDDMMLDALPGLFANDTNGTGGCPDISGVWDFVFTNINSSCGPESDWSSTVTIVQNGCSLETTGIKNTSFIVIGRIENNTVTIGPENFPDGGGTTRSTFTLTIKSKTSMEGKESWTWSSSDMGSCIDGTGDITATKN